MKNNFSFEKKERVASQKLIDELFTGGNSQSVAAFPLRAVYMVRQRKADEAPVQVLVSVAKRRLHHAVDRNRTKRQLREAYRLNKHRMTGLLPDGQQLVIAFIWLADGLHTTEVVASRVKSLLKRVGAKLQTKNS